MSGAALVLGLGALIAAAGLGPLKRQAQSERWLLASLGAILALAVFSLLLARIGFYSPWVASCLLLLTAGGLTFASRKYGWGAARHTLEAPAGHSPYLPGLLIALFGLYAVFPTYFVLGGQDPGVYLVLAARIATTGSLDLDLPWMREVWQAHSQGLAIGYPGVYSLLQSDIGNDPSRLSPQFMHLFPALAANAFATGGIEAIVRVNAVLAVLTLWVGFAYLRRLVNETAALVFVLVLGLNPAFLWGARITLTEVLAALLNLAGLFLLMLARERERRQWAIGAGIVLGLGVFNRLDAAFAGIPVLGFALATVVERRLAPIARSAAVAYLITSSLGFLDGRLFAPFYFQTLLGKHHLGGLIAISTLSAALAAAVASLSDATVQRFKLDGQLLQRAGGEVLRVLAFWVVVALFAWPLVDSRSDARAARELGWYLTPLAWPLTLLGFGLALVSREWSRWLPLLAFVATALVAYTLGPGVVPEHIWASRRWLSHVIPLFAVLGTYGASECIAWARRKQVFPFTVASLLAVGYFGAAIWFARPFLFRSMLEGLPEAYSVVQERVKASNVRLPLVTGSHHVASILTYLYDVPTVLFGGRTMYGLDYKPAREALGRGDFENMQSIGLDPFTASSTLAQSGFYAGDFLKPSVGQPPTEIQRFELSLDIGVVGGKTLDLEIPVTNRRIVTKVGKLEQGALHTTGRAGTLQNGPHARLNPGQYEVDWIGRVSSVGRSKQQGYIDVISDAGTNVLASMPLRISKESPSETWLGGVEFSLDRSLPGVELRMRVEADVDLALTRMRLRRIVHGTTVPAPEPAADAAEGAGAKSPAAPAASVR